MNQLIENNKQKIFELCKKHYVKELYLFGSAARDDFNENSDIDFLIEFNNKTTDPFLYVENNDQLKLNLELLLHREVDLIKYSNLKNKYLKYFIDQEKKLLYAQA
jgi:predicted nucleotidyltransferase